jgi:3-phenylpropionate/trans-cinnamate dioxygenase ferredoxin component
MEWVRIFTGIDEANRQLADNHPRLLILRGQRICLVRRGEQFFAVQDTCTHNGESLSKGSLNYLGEIICPWHNYRFDLQTGREGANRSADLKTYPLKIEQEGFYIGIF